MFILGRETSLLFLVPLTAVAISLDIARFYSDRCARVINAIFGSMMRPDEWESQIGFRLNGATWVLVAACLLTALFPVQIAAPVFATFMVADAAAAITGRLFGRHNWKGSTRTLEGSLAFFAVSVLLLLLFPAVGLFAAFLAALVGSFAEAATFPLNDNVRVPVIMALVIWILSGVI